MGTYGSIDFNDEEIEAAGHWYGGQGSMLYAITSTGALKRGTIRPRHDDGTPMTDEEWIVDLAERLESEAEEAARDAATQAKKAKGSERKELLADRDGLRGIAFKARRYIDDAERARAEHGEKWLTTRHLTPSRGGAVRRTGHAMKKSSAQLQREIDEALARAPERLKAGDVVQLRWEPGTGGIVRRVDSAGVASVSTPHGDRSVPSDALVRVRKEHEDRVRRSVGSRSRATNPRRTEKRRAVR